MDYDFSGWATKANVKCTDTRVILKDAFKHQDGEKVPLVWNHRHGEVSNVLGHAVLENRDEGVYAYCTFADTEEALKAKKLVHAGAITKLSIYANQLKQQGSNVIHGTIRELSLVLAGANPEAYIDSIMRHSDSNGDEHEEAIIFFGDKFADDISLYHAEEETEEVEEEAEENVQEVEETKEVEETIEHAEESKEEKSEDDETVEDLYETFNDKQKDFVNALLGLALEKKESSEDKKEDEQSEGGNKEMKQNVFEQDAQVKENVICHADQEEIIKMAQKSNVGSFQRALKAYCEDNELAHSFEEETIGKLFPEFEDVKPGAPELIENDHEWVNVVMKEVHKSPISRIRTRQMDARSKDLRAKGYKKGEQKTNFGNLSLLERTTDPQTVYVKDNLHRDDIIDIKDFDVVKYLYGVMKSKLYEEIAMAIMVGDQREPGEPDKISEDHIRSIWNDDELYTIHCDVDYEAAKAELQGTDTEMHFGENYVKAEATITASLYAREQYKGKSVLDCYMTPHQLNVMLLARDLNGRRIYSSKADLAKELNVRNIYTAEQFEGLVRTDKAGKKHKLVALFVNLGQYHLGSTKGGEITNFEQFDIDYNQYKYLIETRVSGAAVNIKSAIALEEPVTE